LVVAEEPVLLRQFIGEADSDSPAEWNENAEEFVMVLQ